MAEVKGTLLEVRVGTPKPNEYYSKQYKWSNSIHPSSYERHVVESVKCTVHGLAGNAVGLPIHIEDNDNRAALIFNLASYKELLMRFPECAKTMVRGGFGENFVVDHPDLSPSIVCVGDVFSIGTAEFTVTGPRYPCPKVDGWHRTEGLRQFVHEHGMGGYFVKVTKEGEVAAGDAITLLKRINPKFPITRICEGLHCKEMTEDTSEFYTGLINMKDLIDRGYKSVARSRLEEYIVRNKPMMSVENAVFCASRVGVAALFCFASIAAASYVS